MTAPADWLRAATQRLHEAGVPDAARDARLLLRWAQDENADSLDFTDPVPDGVAARAEDALARRIDRVPLSQIIGRRSFWKHTFRVSADVLDPRPDTETLVVTALEGPTPSVVVDLGVGSGCILLSLLAEWPDAVGIGVDVSAAALAMAKENARALKLCDRVTWVEGHWLAPLEKPVDLIVSNPPYLSAADLATAQPELRHEPRIALDGGSDGLAAYRAIAGGALEFLKPGGRLIVEIGAEQGPAVTSLLRETGLLEISLHADIRGLPRVVSAKAPETAN